MDTNKRLAFGASARWLAAITLVGAILFVALGVAALRQQGETPSPTVLLSASSSDALTVTSPFTTTRAWTLRWICPVVPTQLGFALLPAADADKDNVPVPAPSIGCGEKETAVKATNVGAFRLVVTDSDSTAEWNLTITEP